MNALNPDGSRFLEWDVQGYQLTQLNIIMDDHQGPLILTKVWHVYKVHVCKLFISHNNRPTWYSLCALYVKYFYVLSMIVPMDWKWYVVSYLIQNLINMNVALKMKSWYPSPME
jgi:hypothetical protein